MKQYITTKSDPADKQDLIKVYKAFQQSLTQGFEVLSHQWGTDLDAKVYRFAKTQGVDLPVIARRITGEQESMRNSVKESIARYIAEDEEGKAKSITAGTDMVNDFTSWMTRVGQYQTKSMIELADAIRANFGQQEAELFKQSVAPALENALNSLTQAREEISNAVSTLAGEQPALDQIGSEMDSGMDDMSGDEFDTAPEDAMNAAPEDEFSAADAAAGGAEAAGRTRRESRELFSRKLDEAHMILTKLSK